MKKFIKPLLKSISLLAIAFIYIAFFSSNVTASVRTLDSYYKKIYTNVSQLKFYLVKEIKYFEKEATDTANIFPDLNSNAEITIKSFFDNRIFRFNSTPDLDGKYIESAQLKYDEFQKPYILVKFNDEGKKILAEVTKNNIYRHLAIALDNSVYSSPIITNQITDGIIQIH